MNCPDCVYLKSACASPQNMQRNVATSTTVLRGMFPLSLLGQIDKRANTGRRLPNGSAQPPPLSDEDSLFDKSLSESPFSRQVSLIRSCCNQPWLLKKPLIRPKRQKSHRVRMPYKRSSRISRHFWSPDFTRITDQQEFFNSHGCYQQ